MIDLKQLRENPNYILESAKAKGVEVPIERILELEKKARSLKSELEHIAAKKNTASKNIPTATDADRTRLIEEMREIDKQADELKAELSPIEEELSEQLYRIPNPALPDVKVAANPEENEIVRTVGTKPEFTFEPKDHEELGTQLGIIDKERAAKTTGARFNYLLGDAVALEFALVQLALTITAKHGFVPITVPQLVNAKSMRGMGYLEHGGHDEIYHLSKDNLYLIGTSEQAIVPMHQDEILDLQNAPMRYIGFSTCFRREAGSYGKDTKGIIRVHQFDKVEMISFTNQETSDQEHELILAIEEELVQALELHYQVVKMVTGDLGLPAARKYDIETWFPSQQTFRETHSASTITDFQARRLNTRYRNQAGETVFAHTLNGTAFAIGRILAAILENHQQEDGSVRIPKALQSFMGGKETIVKR